MITLITGHYGSGKTTAAANLAKRRACEGTTALVDMDTVNPYFRAADLRAFLEENGVTLIAPMYARTNLDLPVLDFDIPAIACRYDNVICDLGGDDAGAFPLGKFSSFIKSGVCEWEHLFTVNFCRPLTSEPEECIEAMNEIVSACRIPVTGIINNTNLGSETSSGVIMQGIQKARRLEELSGIPVRTTSVPDTLEGFDEKCITRFRVLIKNIWD